MKHLDDETERRETELINLKLDLEKVTFDLAMVRNTYKSRTASIEDWLNYKIKKKEKEEQAAREEQAATKIQVNKILVEYISMW